MLANLQEFPKRKKNKRKLASLIGCKTDLKSELPLLFKAFEEALSSYEFILNQIKPESRARGFEASLLNTKMIESIQKYFPSFWRFAKYKRFTLNVKGYVILFKKLNNSDKPMNIKTKSVNAISDQLSLPLFDNDSNVIDPILFFGYRKNKDGIIFDPKLVYIDENQVQWTINENDIDNTMPGEGVEITPVSPAPRPVLKKNVQKKVSND